ncbi:hypothetical protein, partial [Stenotrophomonas pavanii]|uniref:hypothetical protein n=2 Tax=Stenotrophomonas TaxID=40323 RepID=UPI002E77030E
MNPSLGLGRGIHAADTPYDPTAPAFDSVRVRQPRKIKRKMKKQRQQPTASGVRSLFRRKRDLT